MPRLIAIGLVSSCLVCGAATADEPFNFAAQQAKINQEFSQAVSQAGGDQAAYRRASTARNVALAKLVAEAEQAKSQEHAALALAYQTLRRLDDAVREARAAIQKKPDDVFSHTVLISALSMQDKPDEAEEAFQAALKQLPDHPSLGGMRQTLAFGYQRRGKFDKAAEHVTAYLQQQWPIVVANPAAAPSFRNLANMLAETGIRGKFADKTLPTIEKYLQEATKAAEKKPELASLVDGLMTAKVRLLIAAERGDEARKMAEEQLAAADRSLKLKPDDATAILAAASARRMLIQLAGVNEAGAAAIDNYRQFIEAHLNRQAESAEFIGFAFEAVSLSSNRLVAAGKYEEAEELLETWRGRLKELKPESAPAKAAVARITSSIGALLARAAGERKRAALIGKPYYPLLEATWLNGSPLKPEELRGKVVLLDFWAVWCGPCIATFPHLREWNEKYGEKGLVIVGVTRRYQYGWDAEAKRIRQDESITKADEDKATLDFVRHHELKHRIAVAPDSELSGKYEVTGIPQAVLIDRDGTIRRILVGSGEPNALQMEAAIRQLLGVREQAAAN